MDTPRAENPANTAQPEVKIQVLVTNLKTGAVAVLDVPRARKLYLDEIYTKEDDLGSLELLSLRMTPRIAQMAVVFTPVYQELEPIYTMSQRNQPPV